MIRYKTGSGFLDLLQNELGTLLGEPNETSTYNRWAPHVDVQTKGDKYIVHADIPGVDPKDIQVHMDGHLLTIEGERKSETKDEGEGYSRIERFFGKFSRSFTLPEDVASEDIVAKYNNGVLKLTIPKIEMKKSRKIEVKQGD